MPINFKELEDIMYDTLNGYAYKAVNKNFGYPDDWNFVITQIDPLGSCRFKEKMIVLDIDHWRYGSDDDVLDTLLHECAHALCGIEISKTGRQIAHGKTWRYFATLVGATPKAKACVQDKRPIEEVHKDKKYFIVHDTGTTLRPMGGCGRKLKNMANRFFKHTPETKGNLWLVKVHDWFNYNGDRDKLLGLLIR